MGLFKVLFFTLSLLTRAMPHALWLCVQLCRLSLGNIPLFVGQARLSPGGTPFQRHPDMEINTHKMMIKERACFSKVKTRRRPHTLESVLLGRTV